MICMNHPTYGPGQWEADHSKGPDGEPVYGFSFVAGHIGILYVVGMSAGQIDQLIDALKAARQDADEPCPGCGESIPF